MAVERAGFFSAHDVSLLPAGELDGVWPVGCFVDTLGPLRPVIPEFAGEVSYIQYTLL